MATEFPLAGRAALITGGGSGIGRGAAIALSREGAAVAVADLRRQAAAETVGMVEAAGGRAISVAMDVTKRASVEQGFAAAVQALGPLDICIANAGGNEHTPGGNTVLNMDLDGWDRVIQLNLNGALYTARAAAPAMIERGWGRIIFMGSAAGYRLSAGGGAYAVSKAALPALTKILARELAMHRITVNCVVPFFVDTPAVRKHFPDDDALEKQMQEGPIANPMHVVLQVEDQIEAILYLCRNSGRYVTGQSLHVDGGSVMM